MIDFDSLLTPLLCSKGPVEDIFREPEKRITKPKNQLILSDAELKAELSLVLTGDDPNCPKNISKFSFKDECYKLDPPGLADHMAIHLVLEGCSLHVDSSEFTSQRACLEKRKEHIEQKRKKVLAARLEVT